MVCTRHWETQLSCQHSSCSVAGALSFSVAGTALIGSYVPAPRDFGTRTPLVGLIMYWHSFGYVGPCSCLCFSDSGIAIYAVRHTLYTTIQKGKPFSQDGWCSFGAFCDALANGVHSAETVRALAHVLLPFAHGDLAQVRACVH